MLSSLWRLAVRRHSERRQECFVGKTENGTMARSEESITLLTSYRLSSLRSGSSVSVLDDILRLSALRQQILYTDPNASLPSLWFWTEVKMPCEKNRKRNNDTEWWIYYTHDFLQGSLNLLKWHLPDRFFSIISPICNIQKDQNAVSKDKYVWPFITA